MHLRPIFTHPHKQFRYVHGDATVLDLRLAVEGEPARVDVLGEAERIEETEGRTHAVPLGHGRRSKSPSALLRRRGGDERRHRRQGARDREERRRHDA